MDNKGHPGFGINETVAITAPSNEAKTVSFSEDHLQDVLTHRSAWRRMLQKVKDETNDNQGTGYYSHEINVFDRTFDLLEKLIPTLIGEFAGGQDKKYKFENGHFVNRVSGEIIPHDEPTVIFRGRDFHALGMLRDYSFMSHDEHHKQAIADRIAEFEAFAINHPERMKEPGISRHMTLNDPEPD